MKRTKPRCDRPAAMTKFQGKHASHWQFWDHGVTSSFLALFMQCREQTRLTFVKGLGSKASVLALEFGQCCHWVLEQAYQRRSNKTHQQTVPNQKWVKATLDLYELKWREENPMPTKYQEEIIAFVLATAEIHLKYYFVRWEGDFTGRYGRFADTHSVKPVRWVSLEQVFKQRYTFKDNKKIWIRGRRDGVFLDRRSEHWVFDTKCLSRINIEEIAETLPSNLQFMLYSWVTWKETGKVPAGIVMNILRRTSLYMRKGGGKVPADDLKSFCARLDKDIAKRIATYFIRVQLSIAKSDLVDFEKNVLNPLLKDVRLWWEGSSPHYMNPNALVTKYGKCHLYNLMVRGDNTNMFVRPHVFSELADA